MTSNELAQIEELLRQGKITLAREQLESVKAEELPRSERLWAAQLCRRADVPYSALRILKPIVQNVLILDSPPAASEIAEYTISLTRLGASRYALLLLDRLPKTSEPSVEFAWTAALFARWRYDQAIPHLERYLESPSLSDYERQVGLVNLAAATLFVQDFDRASTLVESLKSELKNDSRFLLLANVLLIAAQLEIHHGRFDKALAFVEEGIRLVKDSNSLYPLLGRKWEAVIHLSRMGATPDGLERLENVRLAAMSGRHWETVRDCDFYRARVTQDEPLFLKLYFGTPFEGYREKIRLELPKTYRIPTRFDWRPLGPGNFHLNMITAEMDGTWLKPDNSIFLLIHELLVDFYAAASPGTLFCELFPEESFDPDHSPNRIFQLVKRLRSFLKSSRLPLEVNLEQGDVRIGFLAPLTVTVPQRFHREAGKEIHFRRLYQKWGNSLFSAQECSDYLGVSRPTVQRLLQWGIGNGLVQKIGETSFARYQLDSRFQMP